LQLQAGLSSFEPTRGLRPLILIFALDRISPLTSGRKQRHLAFISKYTSILVFVPDTSNVMADALSRPVSGIAALVCAAIADRAPFYQMLCFRDG
jgi:hypothetical protein